MTEESYRGALKLKSQSELVDIIIRQYINMGNLLKQIKILEERHMEDKRLYEEQIDKTSRINKYWSQKERGLRRDDFDNSEVIERYTSGESAYKIAKDLGVGQMTIISRLKRAGVYEGKEHNNKGGDR